MENRHVTRFFVEPTESQVPRRPRDADDGANEVWLSRRQYRLFMAVGVAVLEEEYNPSFLELCYAAGYPWKSSVRESLHVLAKLGLVKVDVRRSRSAGLTKMGKDVWRAWREKPPSRRRTAKPHRRDKLLEKNRGKRKARAAK